MSGVLGARGVRRFEGDDKPTCPTFSDDEIDAMYGLAAADPCTCFRDGEWFPESCNRADHHPKEGAA